MAHSRGIRQNLRALAGRLGEQWERERRDTLFLMGAILLAVVPHVAHLPWWTSSGFFVLFLWRFGLVMSGRWLPRDSVRWVAAIACTGAVYANYGTLLGRDAGVALLVLFLGLKLMEMRARRDLFVVIFLCFFLLLTTFFYSQTFATAVLTLVAVLGLLSTMVTMQFGRRELSTRAALPCRRQPDGAGGADRGAVLPAVPAPRRPAVGHARGRAREPHRPVRLDEPRTDLAARAVRRGGIPGQVRRRRSGTRDDVLARTELRALRRTDLDLAAARERRAAAATHRARRLVAGRVLGHARTEQSQLVVRARGAGARGSALVRRRPPARPATGRARTRHRPVALQDRVRDGLSFRSRRIGEHACARRANCPRARTRRRSRWRADGVRRTTTRSGSWNARCSCSCARAFATRSTRRCSGATASTSSCSTRAPDSASTSPAPSSC